MNMEKIPVEFSPVTPNLPEYLKMYEISGQDPITEHSFERYRKDKQQDALIRENQENPDNLLKEREKIRQRKEHAGLDFKIDRELREAAFCKLLYEPASNKERMLLFEKGLGSPNVKVQNAYLSAFNKGDYFEGLENRFQEIIAKKIDQKMKSQNAIEQIRCSRMIRFLPESEVAFYIRQGLDSQDVEVQRAFAEQICYIPESDITTLIKKAMSNPDIGVRAIVNRMIWSAPQNEVPFLIEEALMDSDMNIRREVIWMQIWRLPEEKKLPFMMKILESNNIELWSPVLRRISELSKEDQEYLNNIFLEKVKNGLSSSDVAEQKNAIKMIGLVPEEEKIRLFNLILKMGLGEEIVKPPLYDGQEDLNKNNFSRREFSKTGSGTTLLGGELKKNTIIRHIKPHAFLSWQRLFEDHAIWQKAGFDYVPIEPIQSYRLNKNGLVDVFSGVLDLSLAEWNEKTEMFGNELWSQKEKIIRVLKKLGIEHGHTHGRNFCLRFFRDADGKIDFKRTPRIYLIDFDNAVSPKG